MRVIPRGEEKVLGSIPVQPKLFNVDDVQDEMPRALSHLRRHPEPDSIRDFDVEGLLADHCAELQNDRPEDVGLVEHQLQLLVARDHHQVEIFAGKRKPIFEVGSGKAVLDLHLNFFHLDPNVKLINV